MSDVVKRIQNYSELDDTCMCYWKSGGKWLLYIPGCGLGTLSDHQIQEHEDGTITATPSILVDGHKNGQKTQRHGYLTRGEWREV